MGRFWCRLGFHDLPDALEWDERYQKKDGKVVSGAAICPNCKGRFVAHKNCFPGETLWHPAEEVEHESKAEWATRRAVEDQKYLEVREEA